MTFAAEKTFTVEGIHIPETSLVREITQFVRDTSSALLFHHSSRVYYWAALAGKHRSPVMVSSSIASFSLRGRWFTTWA